VKAKNGSNSGPSAGGGGGTGASCVNLAVREPKDTQKREKETAQVNRRRDNWDLATRVIGREKKEGTGESVPGNAHNALSAEKHRHHVKKPYKNVPRKRTVSGPGKAKTWQSAYAKKDTGNLYKEETHNTPNRAPFRLANLGLREVKPQERIRQGVQGRLSQPDHKRIRRASFLDARTENRRSPQDQKNPRRLLLGEEEERRLTKAYGKGKKGNLWSLPPM